MNGLKYIMKLENMTTLEVAQRLKVNRSLISVWQTGRRKIPDNRINELIGVFPKYPAYYFNKDLTNEDMSIIRDIKTNKKADIKPQKDNRLNRAESIVQEQINEYGRLLSDIAEILKIGDFSAILNNANYLSDKQMLTLFLTVVSSSQQRYLHDYNILNKLEYMKRNAEAHNIEDFKLCLIGVAMSALAAAYGIEDDVTTLSIPDKVRTMLPNEALNNDSDIKLFSEWKDRIVAVLKDIIDYCNERQKIINEMNEKLRRARMIIEFLEDIIKEISDFPNDDKRILMAKKRLIYDVTREHKDDECVISTQGSDLFDNVGKLLISDKSEECIIFNIIIDYLKNEISCIEYINSDEDLIREDIAQSVYRELPTEQIEKYHELCKKIVDSAYLVID